MAQTTGPSKVISQQSISMPLLSGEVPQALMPLPSVWVRRTVGGISALAGVLALGGFGLGLASVVSGSAGPGAFWMMLFQLCAVVACVMGVLSGAGRFRSGPAMTPLIVAGVLLVASTLSEPSLIRSGMPRLEVMGVPLRLLAMAELLAALVMGGLSAMIVILRKPRKTLPMLLIGLALLAPAMGAAVGVLLPSVRSALTGLSPVVLTLAVVGAMGVLIVLVSVGSQFVIRAIEIGIEEGLGEGEASRGGAA